jgi:undecaprenyl-diphosphatase
MARDQQRPAGRHGHAAGHGGHGGGHGGYVAGHAAGRAPGQRGAEGGGAADPAVAADQRLSTMGYKRAVIIGAAQILALLPGISRDGIVTVVGMGRGLSRQDAVRFSFLLSAPVILAAGALKAKDLTGPLSTGIHGPIVVGSLISGIGAYLSIRFLTKYFSEEKSLNPFGIYCLIAGLASLAYLVLK